MVQILVTSRLMLLIQASSPTDESRCVQKIKTNLVAAAVVFLYEATENGNALWDFFHHLSWLSLLWDMVDGTLATNLTPLCIHVLCPVTPQFLPLEGVPCLTHSCEVWPHDLLWAIKC